MDRTVYDLMIQRFTPFMIGFAVALVIVFSLVLCVYNAVNKVNRKLDYIENQIIEIQAFLQGNCVE